MYEETFERIRQLGRLSTIIAENLPPEILGSVERTQYFIDHASELREKLAGTFCEEGTLLVPNSPAVVSSSSQPLVTTLSIISGFDRDMRDENWKLLKDTDDSSEFDASRLELVSFLETGETYTGGETMLKRARGKEPVNGQMLAGCNWGQRHGEALLRNQHLLPVEWRGRVIVLPGTVWRNVCRNRSVTYLVFDGEQWVLDFYWLGNCFSSGGRLLRLRELLLAA